MKKFRFLVMLVVMLAVMCSVCACAQSAPNATEQPQQTTQTNPTNNATNPSETTPVDDGKVTYIVKIVDEAGKPISDVLVQLCKDSCVPNKTNAEGIAEYRLVEDDYKASIMSMPAGYAHISDKTEFYFEDGSYEVIITLKAA